MTERIDTKAVLEKWRKTYGFDRTYPAPLSEWWDALAQEIADREADRTRIDALERLLSEIDAAYHKGLAALRGEDER